MSFVCHIWEYPTASSVDEALAIRDALEDQGGPQNPRFVELARRLTRRHPCITTLEGEAIEEQGVWTDGPLDGISDSPVYAIGILSQHLDTVYPFVCETANDLGLHVMDEASGCVYRPDGRVLEFGEEKPLASALGAVDVSRLEGALRTALEDVGRAGGFRRVADRLVRGTDGGWQALSASITEANGGLRVKLAIDVYFHQVTRLIGQRDPKRRASEADGRAFVLPLDEFLDAPGTLVMREPDDFPRLLQRAKPLVAGSLMALADECRTLEGLHLVMNGGRIRQRGKPLAHLIVARLLCDRSYDAIYDRLCDEGVIDASNRDFMGTERQVLAMILRCANERVLLSSVGPAGAKSGVVGGRQA